MKHESDSDSYDGEVENVCVDEPDSYTSVSEVETTNSVSDSSVAIQALQWVEMKSSGLPHNKKHLSRA
jgi:hypothetical protein